MLERIGFSLILTGWIVIALGTTASIFYRRREVRLNRWIGAGSALATHPERYVRPARARAIRSIFVVGLVLVAAGAVVAFIAGMARS
jgi:hypothetical protein